MVSEDRKMEGLALSLSIADNLTLSSLASIRPPSRASPQRAEDWIEKLGIRCRGPEQPVGDLSGGNQQKVAIARLLQHGVDVLLLDEPTRGIDVGSKAQIYQLIDELAGEGKAVLIVSSYLPELLGVCDRIAVMCKGRLQPARPVSELDEHDIMLEATASRRRPHERMQTVLPTIRSSPPRAAHDWDSAAPRSRSSARWLAWPSSSRSSRSCGPHTFLTADNFQIMLLQTAVVGTAALGMTLIIISGGIDLSIGSNIALCTVAIALLLAAAASAARRRARRHRRGRGVRRAHRPAHHAAGSHAVHRHARHVGRAARRGQRAGARKPWSPRRRPG